MLGSQCRIALRSLGKNKRHAVITITGLAIGMTCCVLIMLWVMRELSYDAFHEKGDRIYRVCHDLTLRGSNRRAPITGPPMGPALVEDFPEVVDAVRIAPGPRTAVKYKENLFYEEAWFYADPSIFEVFSFPLVKGDPGSALTTAGSVVLSRTLARKYFGDEDPIGKPLSFGAGKNYSVTGVMKDVPGNSHLKLDMLVSLESLRAEDPAAMDVWGRMSLYTYVLLEKNSDAVALDKRLGGFLETHMEGLAKSGVTLKLFLQPLSDIHLHSRLEGELGANGSYAQVCLFSGIALFILFIACVNFVNLATARFAKRAKEVGVRKTFGAQRTALVAQFLGESTGYSLIAMTAGLVLLFFSLPYFSAVTGQALGREVFAAPWFLPSVAGIALMVGIAAGIYPAFFLSSFRPVQVLSGKVRTGPFHSRFRKALVVFQFTLSVGLVIATGIVHKQLDYLKNKPLGFDKEDVLVIPNVRDLAPETLRAVKEELGTLAGVERVAASSAVPGKGRMALNFLPEGFSEEESQIMAALVVDEDLLPLLDIQLAAGRNFSKDQPADRTDAVIINETAARRFGWDEPIGKTISSKRASPQGPVPVTWTVIGVARDFHFASLRETIEPLVVAGGPLDPHGGRSPFNYLSVRIARGSAARTSALLKAAWNERFPERPFDSLWLDETFDGQYKAEDKFGSLISGFSLLAIFVACLGLIGMASFGAEQRTKEIGVRKVLGASSAGIVRLLTKEVFVLVVLANAVAWPVTHYVMKRWLEDFAYRADVGLPVFLVSGLAALAIALLTVGALAVKAARGNPAVSLRYE